MIASYHFLLQETDELGDEERGNGSAHARYQGVVDHEGDGLPVSRLSDGELRSAVERQEAEDEDKGTQCSQLARRENLESQFLFVFSVFFKTNKHNVDERDAEDL